MNRTAVISANVASIGYDSNTTTLEVEFKDGSVYHYLDVPDAVYQELMGASSKGKFMHANIKNSFRCTRM